MVDLFMARGEIGVAAAASIARPPKSTDGIGVIAGLRAQVLAVADGLHRTGKASAAVYGTVRRKLHFELVASPKPGPKPLFVFVNEMSRGPKGWKLGSPWGVACVAFDDDAEPVAWDAAVNLAHRLEGMRLAEPPERVPWCIVVASAHAELGPFAEFMECIVNALHESRQGEPVTGGV